MFVQFPFARLQTKTHFHIKAKPEERTTEKENHRADETCKKSLHTYNTSGYKCIWTLHEMKFIGNHIHTNQTKTKQRTRGSPQRHSCCQAALHASRI